jgi:hypothetical protein
MQMPAQAANIMTAQCHYSNQPNHMHKNSSTSGNSSSLSHTPLFEHTLTYATLRHATTNTFTRLRCSAVMKKQQHQCGLMRLTCRIERLDKEVHQAMAVMDKDMGKLLNYRQLMNSPKYKKAWSLSAANKFRQLAHGIGWRIKNPTNTIEFISQHKVPADRRKDITYGQFVCLVRPKKAEPNQMQFTVGGNRINYPGEVATPTAEMLVAKMLFNSVISTKDAWFMTINISTFYLMTPLHCVEFI